MTAAALWLCACGDGKKSQISQDVRDRSELREELRQSLVGTWTRRVRTADSLWEGLRLDPDGRFGLFGIHTMHGLQWLVRADTIILTTSSENYAQPQESRLAVQLVGLDSLVLWAEKGYLVGAYERGTDMARRVTGTVNHRFKLASGPDAALYLELRGLTEGAFSKYLASQSLPVGGEHTPWPFQIYYAASDAVGIEAGLLSVTLVIDGVPRLNLDSGFTVPVSADAEGVEIWLAEPPS